MNDQEKGINHHVRIRRNGSTAAMIGLLVGTVAGWPSAAQAGSLSYLVTVDSTGIAGTSGFLEALLATSAPPVSPTVTATISSESTDGVLGAVTISTPGDRQRLILQHTSDPGQRHHIGRPP